jgi:hypothetical protein
MADYKRLGAGILSKIMQGLNSKPARLASEGLGAYSNPYMWGYGKLAERTPLPSVGDLADKIPVVGPWIKNPVKELLRPRPMPGKAKPSPNKRGRWPRKKLRQPVRKNRAGQASRKAQARVAHDINMEQARRAAAGYGRRPGR